MVGFWEKYGLEGKGNSSKPKKEQTDEQPTPAKTKNNSDDKDKNDKKHRTTNDLSELADILEKVQKENSTPKAEETKKRNPYFKSRSSRKNKRRKRRKNMAETFTLTDIQKEACVYLGIDPATIKDEEAMKKAFAGKIEIQGNRIIDLVKGSSVYVGKAETKEEKDSEKSDDGLDPSDSPSKPGEIIVHEQDTPTPQPHTDMHWIVEKIRDYTKMKEDGKAAIKEFSGDKTAGTFTAEIDNGTVTYTSPNDVSVTKDSSYKVFDTMMQEPSNAGKAVRLPEDATAEFRTNLFVAAVLNGHKVNGAEGFELDEATLAKINLDETKRAQVKAALPKQEKATQEKTTQEKPAEEKPSEKVTEAITKLKETQAKLAELIKDGKVSATISSNREEILVFNFDASKGGNQANADEANKLFTEARKSIDDLRQKTLPTDENSRKQAVVDNYALKSALLGLIRSVYQPEPSEAVKAMDRIRAKQLGLIKDVTYKYVKDKNGHFIRNKKGDLVEDKYQKDETGKFVTDEKGRRVVDKNKQVKTLTGENLESYQSKMFPAVLARLEAEYGSK